MLPHGSGRPDQSVLVDLDLQVFMILSLLMAGIDGEILKIVKLVVHTDTYILVKCRWFPLEAALSDAVTQNIYLRTDMPWETKDAFIEAKDINNQVVVAPIPWKPLRLARYTGNKVPLNIRHRTDVLAVVLDRYVDFVGDIGDSSSDDED